MRVAVTSDATILPWVLMGGGNDPAARGVHLEKFIRYGVIKDIVDQIL